MLDGVHWLQEVKRRLLFLLFLCFCLFLRLLRYALLENIEYVSNNFETNSTKTKFINSNNSLNHDKFMLHHVQRSQELATSAQSGP